MSANKRAVRKNKGRVPTQNTIISRLESLAEKSGYVVQTRGADKKKTGALAEDIKRFLPDLILDAYRGASRYVFEVEKTITNQTIFKSLTSLLYFLCKNKKSKGVLVVPGRNRLFAAECLNVITEIIRGYDRGGRGARMKIFVEVVSFDEVTDNEKKVSKWFTGGKKGPPPKCKFLPRA